MDWNNSGQVSLLGGALNAGANLLGTGINNYFNRKNVQETNAMNMQNWKDQRAYDERMTREQWDRDDTAMQRTVADYQNVGLSPLAINGPMDTTPAISPESPPNAIPFQAQQPNIEFNSMIDHYIKLEDLKERKDDNLRKRGNEQAEMIVDLQIASSQIEANIKNIQAQIKSSEEMRQKEIDSNEVMNEANIESKEKIAAKEIAQREVELLEKTRQFNATLEEQMRATKKKEDIEISKAVVQYIKDLTGQDVVATKYEPDPVKYDIAMKTWRIAYLTFLDKVKNYKVQFSESESFSHGFDIKGNIFGTGAGSGSKAGFSNSYSQNKSVNLIMLYSGFFTEHPYPVQYKIYQ